MLLFMALSQKVDATSVPGALPQAMMIMAFSQENRFFPHFSG